MEGVRNVLKVSELNNSVKERAYQENLREKYEAWSGGEVQKEWEKFRDIVLDACGMIRVGGQRRMGNEVGGAVAEKRRAVGEWLQRRDS